MKVGCGILRGEYSERRFVYRGEPPEHVREGSWNPEAVVSFAGEGKG
jgi:hypothetical protein